MLPNHTLDECNHRAIYNLLIYKGLNMSGWPIFRHLPNLQPFRRRDRDDLQAVADLSLPREAAFYSQPPLIYVRDLASDNCGMSAEKNYAVLK
jgi:hypothetical protein